MNEIRLRKEFFYLSMTRKRQMYSNDFFKKSVTLWQGDVEETVIGGESKRENGCGGPEVGRKLEKGEEGQASIHGHGLQDKVQFRDNCFYLQKSEGRAVV